MVLNLLLILAIAPTSPSEVAVPDYDVTALDADIVAFLEENVGEITDPFKRLNTLVTLIFAEDSLNLIYDNSRTKTAVETFHTRNGNCLSFTNLFVGMARHLGMNAYFQEVTNFPTWDKHGDVVVLNRHMNVVVRINNTSYTMDFNPDSERKEQNTRVVSDARAKAQFYNNLGAEFFQSGDLKQAIAHFKKSLEVDPKLSFTYSNLGVAYVTRGDFVLAEQAYHKALEVSRREYTAISNLARLYKRTKQYEKHEEYEARAKRFRNKNPYYHYSRGEMAFADGRFEDAIKHYKTALRRKPKEHDFHFAIARTYSEMGELEKAAESLKKARKLAPDVFNRHRYSQKLESLAGM